jgi:predicted MFS family arabinose efflux permease
MGVVLLFMAAGAFVAMPFTGQLLDGHSSARVTRAATLVLPGALFLPLLAPGPVTLAAALALFGGANGAMDVAMNAHGVAVENRRGRPIMSSLHACWSFGGLAGAGAVGAAAALGVDPRVEGAVAALLVWMLGLAATRRLGNASLQSETHPGGLALPSRAVALLGGLCFLVMTAEGAMADWGGLYLSGELGASRAAAATAFAGFSLGMAFARLAGDPLRERYSSARVLVGGVCLAAGALAVALVAGETAVALGAFVLVGVGVANAVPLLFSAAGRVPPAGPSLAAVFTMGYLGFVVGPPAIGALAAAATLPTALAVVCVALVVVALFGGRAVARAGTDHDVLAGLRRDGVVR